MSSSEDQKDQVEAKWADMIGRPDEIDRETHEVEARNYAVAADREASRCYWETARVFAEVSQAHSLVALTQLFGKSAT